MHIYEREVNFYKRLGHRVPVHVPRCYHADFDADTGQSTLLLEFLEGDCRDEMVGPTHAQAKLALQAAASLHKFGREEDIAAEPWIHRLDGAEFLDGMVQGATEAAPLAAERLQGLAPEWLLDAAPHASAIISEQLRAISALPHTLIHFDFRVGNMLFRPKDQPMEVALIDWQALLSGPGVCDVAMLAFVSLPVDRRREWEHDLVLGYLADVGEDATGTWPSWFEEAWCRMAIFLAANMIRNTPVFDLSNQGIRDFVSVLCARIDAAIQDHQALRYLR